MSIGVGSSWDNDIEIHDNFQVLILKPIQMKPGEQVVGHASSNVGQLEAEIEKLKKRIQKLESEKPIKKRHRKDAMMKDNDCKDFFDYLKNDDSYTNERSTNERSKRNTRRTRKR